MSEQDVKVRFTGDASDLEKEAENARQAVDGLTTALAGIAGALSITAVFEGLKDLAVNASDADLSMRKLALAMSNTGAAFDPTKFDEFAASLARTTTFSQDAVVAAGSMAAKYKLTQAQIEGLMPKVADLAAFMGRDLTSATDDVSRAITVGGRALQGLGLGFTTTERAVFDASTATERYTLLQQKLAATVGGFATTAAASASGALQQLANNFDEAKQAMGGIIATPFTEAIQAMNVKVAELQSYIAGLSPDARLWVTVLGGAAVAVGTLAAGLVTLAGGMAAVGALVPALSAGFASMGAVASASWSAVFAPVLAGVAVVGGLILVIGAVKQAWENNLGSVRTTVLAWVSDIKGFFQGMFDWVLKAWHNTFDFISQQIETVRNLMKGLSLGDAVAQAKATVAAGQGTLPDFFNEMSAGAAVVKRALGESWDALKTTFGVGTDQLLAWLKQLFPGLEAKLGPASPIGKIAANGIKVDVNTELSKQTSGEYLKMKPAQDLALGSQMAADSGGQAAASQFFRTMEEIYAMAPATLQRIAAANGATQESVQTIMDNLHGATDKTVTSVMNLTKDSMTAVLEVARATEGMSDEEIQAILKAGNGNIAQAVKIADNLNHVFDETGNTMGMVLQRGTTDFGAKYYGNIALMTDGWSTFAAYFDTFLAQARATLDGLLEGLKSFGAQILQHTGSGAAGGVIQAGIQGGMAGGPIGAIGGAIGGLASQSTALGPIMEKVNAMIAKLVPIFDSLFKALGPIIDALAPIVQAVGNVLKVIVDGLQPLFNMIAEILQSLAPLISGFLNVVGKILGALFAALNPVIKALSPIIAIIGSLLQTLTPLLNVLVVAFKMLFIPLQIFGTVLTALKPVFELVGVVANMVAQVIMMVFNAISWVYNGIVEIVASIVDAFSWLPFVGDDIHDFANYIRSFKIDTQSQAEQTDDAQTALTDKTDTLADSTSTASDNMTKLSDTVDTVNQSLSNTPQGFDIALERFNALLSPAAPSAASVVAATAIAAGIAAPAQGGAVPPRVIQNITIKTNDATALHSQLKTLQERDNFLNTGSPITPTSPYAGSK